MSFNTLEQRLTGYKGLMRYIEGGTDSMELARVKNGFLDKGKGTAFRDIKVNIVFHSETDPDNPLSMICEGQLSLNQYLHEKKRIHKLYSILRDRKFFEMVVKAQEVQNEKETTKDIRDLKFDPILHVKKQVQQWSYNDTACYKCSVDSELGLLGMNCGYEGEETFFCVDMATKTMIWERKAHRYHSHHWVISNGQKYLSLQTNKNTIQMLKFVKENKSFDENETLRFCIAEGHEIVYNEFDRDFKNIFILKDFETLEKWSVGVENEMSLSITLNQKVSDAPVKQLALSDDGSLCAIGGGDDKSVHLIVLKSKHQIKLTSTSFSYTRAPCFINGSTEQVAVGGASGEGVEIWNVRNRESHTRISPIFC